MVTHCGVGEERLFFIMAVTVNYCYCDVTHYEQRVLFSRFVFSNLGGGVVTSSIVSLSGSDLYYTLL